MSGRPRIRSVKPEIWQDESVGHLSQGARLLLLGLLTMADDEGRLRALPALIIGHVFPYDDVSPARLRKWMKEVEDADLILSYEDEAIPYVAFRHWARHQKINRPSASVLPEPPDTEVVTANSVNESVRKQGGLTTPRAGAHSDPIRSDPDPLLERFERVTFAHSLPSVEPTEIRLLHRDYPGVDLEAEMNEFVHFWSAGRGKQMTLPDPIAAFRRHLDRNKAAAKAGPPPRRVDPRSTVADDLAELEAEHAKAVAEEAAA